jgi:hypothetical protein
MNDTVKKVCEWCKSEFDAPIPKRNRQPRRFCSGSCQSRFTGKERRGVPLSAETRQKMSQSQRRIQGDPEWQERRQAAAKEGFERWKADPASAGKRADLARQSSERMKKRHQDPEFQKRRNARSSRVMKENWNRFRDKFIQDAIRKYHSGKTIGTPEAEAKKRAAAKWIMTQAQAALHTETDYDATYAEVQRRIRLQNPYTGPENSADYFDYLRWLGREVTTSPECRAIADGFLSKAIPRFADEWNRQKSPTQTPRD